MLATQPHSNCLPSHTNVGCSGVCAHSTCNPAESSCNILQSDDKCINHERVGENLQYLHVASLRNADEADCIVIPRVKSAARRELVNMEVSLCFYDPSGGRQTTAENFDHPPLRSHGSWRPCNAAKGTRLYKKENFRCVKPIFQQKPSPLAGPHRR